MELKMFTVFDSKAEAYLQPFFMQSKGLAIRAFSELVNDKEHAFGKYPAEFALFEIGDFNCSNGQFLLPKSPMFIGSGNEFVKQPMVDVVKSRVE